MAKVLTNLAKSLRERLPDGEQFLCSRHREGRFEGMKFRCQRAVEKYSVGFVYLERKLIIELDCGHHALLEEIQKDKQRDDWLEDEGYTVVRFSPLPSRQGEQLPIPR